MIYTRDNIVYIGLPFVSDILETFYRTGNSSLFSFLTAFYTSSKDSIEQGCPTRGPRAACGPLSYCQVLLLPAKRNNFGLFYPLKIASFYP